MRIFELHKDLIEIERNDIISNKTFGDDIRMYVFTHSGVARDEIVQKCKTLPYNEFKIILDFSLFDFPITHDDYKEIQDLSKNFFIISCNWRLIEYDNHAFFDPKLYKFSSQDTKYKDQINHMKFIFRKNLGFVKPKKFINLTNHIRRERIHILNDIFPYKSEGYLAFPDPKELSDLVLGFDESIGGWDITKKLIDTSVFKDSLPIRFDFFKAENNDGENINDYYSIDNDELTMTRQKLFNVGLEFNYGMYLTSYLDVFSETFYSKDWKTGELVDNLIHSSEKTINPIWAHLPLTCLDNKDKMKYMKKIGFSFECPLHTPEYIDEMLPSDEKTKEFTKFVLDILKKDIREIHTIYLQYYKEFEHNFDIMTTKFTIEFVQNKIKQWLENTYQHSESL